MDELDVANGATSDDENTIGIQIPTNDQSETPELPHHSAGTTAEETPTDDPELPATSLHIVLGDAGGAEVVWQPDIQGSPHLFVTGIPGQGKSWAILRLLIELSDQNVPALVFDFHGQMSDPTSHYVQHAHPTVLDAAAGLPFSPFECAADGSSLGWNATAYTVADIFAYVCGLGDIQKDALYTCIRDAYRSYGFGNNGVPPPAEYPSLDDVVQRIERAERQRRGQNLIARCRPILEMDLFRPPGGRRVDLLESVRSGLVVDLHRLGSETLQLATGAFLLRKLYSDMFQWGMAKRLRLAIVLDEAHRLAKDVTLPKLMKEGRKFGVVVIVASQGLADFHPDVVANAGTKIAFRANYPESRKVAGFFRPRAGQDVASSLEGLSVGTALVQTPAMSVNQRVQMRPPIFNR